MSLRVRPLLELVLQLLVPILERALGCLLTLDLLEPLQLVLAPLLLQLLLSLPPSLNHHVIVLIDFGLGQWYRDALQFQFIVVAMGPSDPVYSEHVLLSVSLASCTGVRMRGEVTALPCLLVDIEEVVVVCRRGPSLLILEVFTKLFPHVLLSELVSRIQKSSSEGSSSLRVGRGCPWVFELSSCRAAASLHAAQAFIL